MKDTRTKANSHIKYNSNIPLKFIDNLKTQNNILHKSTITNSQSTSSLNTTLKQNIVRPVVPTLPLNFQRRLSQQSSASSLLINQGSQNIKTSHRQSMESLKMPLADLQSSCETGFTSNIIINPQGQKIIGTKIDLSQFANKRKFKNRQHTAQLSPNYRYQTSSSINDGYSSGAASARQQTIKQNQKISPRQQDIYRSNCFQSTTTLNNFSQKIIKRGMNSSCYDPHLVNTYESMPLTERRRGSVAVDEEIQIIHQRQREKEAELRDQFDFLRQKMREAFEANKTQQMNQTQNIDIYQQKMEKFEQIIECLMNNQKQTQEELNMTKQLLQSKSSNTLFEEPLKNIQNQQEIFRNRNIKSFRMSLNEQPSTYRSENNNNMQQAMKTSSTHFNKNISPSKINSMSETLQLKQYYDQVIISSGDENNNYGDEHFQVISPVPTNKTPKVSIMKKDFSVQTFNLQQNQKVDDQKAQMLTYSTSQDQRILKNFINETLHTLNDYDEDEQDIYQIKDKLQQYYQKLSKASGNQQILFALEKIINKMDNEIKQSQKKNLILLDDENLLNSNEKSKIICDESIASPQNIPNQNCGFLDTDEMMVPIQTISSQCTFRRNHKSCNKSGYQVKHSKYADIYQCQPQSQPSVRGPPALPITQALKSPMQPLETNEEGSWRDDIKNLKGILGGIAERESLDPNEISLMSQNRRFTHQQCGYQQCLIF